VKQLDRIGGGNRAVEQVAGNCYQVDFFVTHNVDQPVDEQRLLVEQSMVTEGPAEMPVAGMQDPHDTQYEQGV